MSITAYIKAVRPNTLLLAITGAVCSFGLALFAQKFSFSVFILTLITSVLLQILANLANDYGDFKLGTDVSGKRIGPVRALQSGKISLRTIKIMIISCVFLTLIAGVSLLYIAFVDNFIFFWLFIGLGIASITAAIKYTIGKNPYGYQGFGDVCSFIFFGLIAVIGGYFLHTKNLSFIPVLPAISLGLLTASVLNINNMRDFDNDKACKKITFAIILGLRRAKIYHVLITVCALLGLVLFNLIYAKHWFNWLYVIIFIAPLKIIYDIYHIKNYVLFNNYLKLTSIMVFLLFVSFVICINF